MIQTLIHNTSFNGKYVALKSFKEHVVIDEGFTPQEAYEKATKKGHANPVITFVPIKNMVQIY